MSIDAKVPIGSHHVLEYLIFTLFENKFIILTEYL